MPMPPPNVTGRWDGFAFEKLPKRTLVGPYRHLNTFWDVFCYLGSCFFLGRGGGGLEFITNRSNPTLKLLLLLSLLLLLLWLLLLLLLLLLFHIGFEYWIDSCTFENQVIPLL